MARLKSIRKATLGGSTLVETIVASVLFLIVFLLAMEMLVRVGGRQPDGVLLQMESDHQACVREFRSGDFPEGEYLRTYGWGEIAVEIEPYPYGDEIQQLRFTVRLETGGQTFVHRILKPAGP